MRGRARVTTQEKALFPGFRAFSQKEWSQLAAPTPFRQACLPKAGRGTAIGPLKRAKTRLFRLAAGRGRAVAQVGRDTGTTTGQAVARGPVICARCAGARHEPAAVPWVQSWLNGERLEA